ncbi:hypothetical protein TNCV_4864761 [Trichonephila clavipes]|nr:hypothetical protein TNCV_4864761 [Trichonephila clavipes]
MASSLRPESRTSLDYLGKGCCFLNHFYDEGLLCVWLLPYSGVRQLNKQHGNAANANATFGGYLVASGFESRPSGLESDALTTRLPSAHDERITTVIFISALLLFTREGISHATEKDDTFPTPGRRQCTHKYIMVWVVWGNFPRFGESLTARGYPSADSSPIRKADCVSEKNPLQNTEVNRREI